MELINMRKILNPKLLSTLRQHSLAINLVIIIFSLTSLVNIAKCSSNINSQQQETTSNNNNNILLQRSDSQGRPQLMVAIYCGANSLLSDANKKVSLYHNQYLDVDTRKWRTDKDPNAFCTQDKREILNYCKKVYPKHDIRNIVESSRPYKLENWCKLSTTSKRKCRTKLTVKPFRCLEGTFQSDALLVPERCLFDHEHNKSICESSDNWNKTATTHCNSKNMNLQSFGMLQPCGLGVFSGVEFVCCPATHTTKLNSTSFEGADSNSDGSSFARATKDFSWSKDSKYETPDEKLNDIKTDDKVLKKHHENTPLSDNDDQQEDSDSDDEDDDEYDDDEDEYDDDSSSWNRDGKSSSTTSTSTTTTTTTTTERPIDHYLSHFDLAHEHDEFRRAELAVESNYRDKITHVMREWSQLDGRYGEMKKKDPHAADDFKKKMTHQFQKTIEALEEEGAAQRHQLASMHAERAMAIINRRKKAAMDCLTQALDRIPIRTHQVERCIVKLLKALEKDRTHTLRQYKNLLNLNTREALREKRIILDHLVTLNRAANQSIAMLDRSPVLVEKLKSKVITLWHKLRNIPPEEPIVRESELKIMEKYEEEVAQRKIEHERQRLIEQEAVQDGIQESTSNTKVKEINESKQGTGNPNNDYSNSVKSTISSPDAKEKASPLLTLTNKSESIDSIVSIKPQNLDMTSGQQQQNLARTSVQVGGHDDIDNEIHYQLDAAKFSHLKVDPANHELFYSVKQPLDNRIKFNFSTLLVSACAIVIVVALVGFKYYNKHSTRAYRRQGFAEVGKSCPEEKTVTNMQFNGYENPAYKYFEAEA